MPEPIVTDPPITPPASPAPIAPPENSTIQHLRQTADDALTAKKEAERLLGEANARLTAIERSKLEETERLKLEKSDLEKKVADAEAIRDEHGRFASAFKSLYDQELAAVPETHRPMIERRSAAGNYAERLDALRDLRSLIVTPAPGARPMGTPTSPGVPGASPPLAPTPPAPTDPKEWGRGSVRTILAERGADPLGTEKSRLPKD